MPCTVCSFPPAPWAVWHKTSVDNADWGKICPGTVQDTYSAMAAMS